MRSGPRSLLRPEQRKKGNPNMARIAIILGCSTYVDSAMDLPAAANDARGMAELLKGTGIYDEVLELLDPETAQDAKRVLSEFIDKYRTQAIEEVFFYFSGHGDF